MNGMRATEWDESTCGPLSLETIRRLFLPPEQYRVSEYRYPPGVKLGGTTRPCVVYVINGECEYRFNSITMRLKRGQYAELPGGDYELNALGLGELLLVLVWKLPFEPNK